MIPRDQASVHWHHTSSPGRKTYGPGAACSALSVAVGEESKRCAGNGDGVGRIGAAGMRTGAAGAATGVEERGRIALEIERRVTGWAMAGVAVVLLVTVPEAVASADLVAGIFFTTGTGFSLAATTIGMFLGGVGEFGGSGVSGTARPLQTRHLQFSGFLLRSVAIQTKWGWKSAADL